MKYSKITSMEELVNRVNIAEHQDKEIVVDAFAKNVINKVFKELSLILPAWQYAWKSDDPQNPDKVLNAAKQQWTKAFIENNISTVAQISHGFAKARKYESDFIPSCGKFISWCEPTPEDLGYPSEQRALRDCISYRNAKKIGMDCNARPWLIELCERVDWWLMNSASSQVEHKKADNHFKEEYIKFINSDYQEPKKTTHDRLETSEVVSKRMSPEQIKDRANRAKDCAAEVKRKIAESKLNKNRLDNKDNKQ